jgi:predicted restriction endonuclease
LPQATEDFAPARVETLIQRIARDSAVVRRLKLLHRNQCQVCDTTLTAPDGVTYSEGHHIQPLGGEHSGPDVAENILIVCPNCHVCSDLGFIALDAAKIRMHAEHKIDPRYIDHHNRRVRKALT